MISITGLGDCLGLGHQGWEEVGWLQEGGLVLAKENVIGCCDAECRWAKILLVMDTSVTDFVLHSLK